MEDRRNEDAGRREDDRRWLKVQGEIMNLVTAQRTTQQVIGKLEVEVGKLEDHVEDVDDHLRGVAGRDSMDTRVAVMEREVTAHGVLLRKISRDLDGIKADVSAIKIHRAITKEVDSTNLERLQEWLKFWGPIIGGAIAIIVPLGTLLFANWDKIEARWKKSQAGKDPVHEKIERAKHPRKTTYVPRVKKAVPVVAPATPRAKEPDGSTATSVPAVPAADEGNAR